MAAQTTDSVEMGEEELALALSVLAGSDPENCSYSRGYVKRQAVFACNTCTPSAAQPAGICLACANVCHDGHEIYELYTKRNFRCDCGNGKFGDFECRLTPAKDETNARNRYNHNFSGCYCTCDRPYPDADDQVNDEMIQCVVCEDWFHTRHLGSNVSEPEDLQEMVCEGCMNKAPFLWTYADRFAVPAELSGGPPEEDVEVDVEAVTTGDSEKSRGKKEEEEEEEPSSSSGPAEQQEEPSSGPSRKRSHGQMSGLSSGAGTCRLRELQVGGAEAGPRQGAVFWPYSWRSELCTCTGCKKAYVEAGVQFLMDQSDTVLAYENRGLAEPFGQHPLMLLTGSMERAQQLEVIYGFNELTTSITAFLEQCATEGKTVTAEAVHEFFEELRARKRRRPNAGFQ